MIPTFFLELYDKPPCIRCIYKMLVLSSNGVYEFFLVASMCKEPQQMMWLYTTTCSSLLKNISAAFLNMVVVNACVVT
jgi:hypothetical protein